MTTPAFPSDGTQAVALAGPAGDIEAVVDVVPGARAIAIVCHPLSTEGGSLHNKVVTMAARAWRECGATTVRFNFRGVGTSAGTFDEGTGEAGDLRAVLEWVRAAHPALPVWLGGFSFGAYVSLAVAAVQPPALLLSIAPPVGRSWDFDAITAPDVPWIVVQGDADEIVDAQAVYRWLEAVGERSWPPRVVRMAGATHFFHGRLVDLRGAIRAETIALLGEAP